MKSSKKPFSDSWPTVVWGDWRTADGKPARYVPEEVDPQIFITGGVGFFYFFRKSFRAAISAWIDDLTVIALLEEEENRRVHKGLFYYQIGLSYIYLSKDTNYDFLLSEALKYMKLALIEDQLSYGRKANSFPAFKLCKELNEKVGKKRTKRRTRL